MRDTSYIFKRSTFCCHVRLVEPHSCDRPKWQAPAEATTPPPCKAGGRAGHMMAVGDEQRSNIQRQLGLLVSYGCFQK